MEDENVVATITLRVRKGDFGRPVWSADDVEGETAAQVLEKVGARLDLAVAQTVPGMGWGDS